MTTIRNISFYGTHTEDTIMYLATLLKGMEMNVCVVDFTENLKYYFDSNDEEVFTVNGMDIYRKAKPEDVEEYDIVLLNLGYDEGFISNLFEADMNIISTGITKREIQQLKTMLVSQIDTKDYIKIFRNVVDTNLTKEYIDTILGVTHNTNAEYILYLDENEWQNTLKMQYFNEITFKGLSREYKKILIDIVQEIFKEEEVKVLIKKIRKIERGKAI